MTICPFCAAACSRAGGDGTTGGGAAATGSVDGGGAGDAAVTFWSLYCRGVFPAAAPCDVDPGFVAPTYPSDNFNFVSSPPSIGFVPFNTSGTCPTCPGRTDPLITPGPVPAGFPTKPFNPAADY